MTNLEKVEAEVGEVLDVMRAEEMRDAMSEVKVEGEP